MSGPTNDHKEKTLVGLAIEAVLIEMGDPVYEKVTKLLHEQYNCYTVDCYDHPEYLNKVLKTLFGNSYRILVEKIEKELGELATKKSIDNFLTTLNK